jgi:hypothetical protein
MERLEISEVLRLARALLAEKKSTPDEKKPDNEKGD